MRVSPLFLASLQRSAGGIYAPPPSIAWDTTPLNLSATSGTYDYYDGNIDYTGTDTNVGCITNTGNGTAVHRFHGFRFRSKSHILRTAVGAAGFEFYDCAGEGLDPVVDGQPWGNIVSGQPNRLIVESSSWKNLGGIRLSTTNLGYERIRYNDVLNLMGWKSNGTGLAGKAGARVPTGPSDTTNYVQTSFVQHNGNTAGAGGAGSGTGGASRSEIGWNLVSNTPDWSLPSDIISNINGGGVSGANLWCHHNMLNGLYFYDPNIQHSARAFQCEGSAAYIDIDTNWFARIQGAVELHGATAHHINVTNSKAIFSKMLNGVALTYPGGPAPFLSGGGGSGGTNQVWTGNEWWWYANGYATDGSGFITYPSNTGNSSSGWVRTGPPWATEADEDALPVTWTPLAVAEAASYGKTFGSSKAWW